MAKSALTWSVALAIPASIVAGLVAGTPAAISVALACTIVVGNVGLSLGLATLANRMGGWAPIAMTMPSFAIRMVLSLVALSLLEGRSFIDAPVFVASFGASLTLALILQSRAWKRTPWLVHAYGTPQKETV